VWAIVVSAASVMPSFAVASSSRGELSLAAPFPGSQASIEPYGAQGPLEGREIAALVHQGISREQASRGLAVQGDIARTKIVRKLLDAPNAFGGVWFESSIGQMHVGVTSPVSRRAVELLVLREDLKGEVVATPVRSTWAQLSATQNRWNRKLALLFARAQVETALAPQFNAVSITLSSSVPERERAELELEASTSDVSVLVSTSRYPQLRLIPDAETKCNLFQANTDEAYCDKPITPGVTIESRNKRALCTAGPLTVPVNNKSRTYLLTAGHCIQKGLGRAKWFAWDTAGGARKEIGQAAQQFVNGLAGDAGAINVNRPGLWSEAGNTPVFAVTAEWAKALEKSYPVKGERSPMVGASNCVEGQTSGGTCGKIKAVGVTFGGRSGLVEEEGDVVTAPGDSGGPVIAETKGEYLVEGFHIDKNTSNNALWEPLETALTLLNTLNLELLTPSNEARPAPSAKEKEEDEKLEKEEKEGAEKVVKEEKEAKEAEEKEGDPLILPAPTVEAPVEFTATIGKVILEANKGKIECKEGTSSGSFWSSREATMGVTLKGCKDTTLSLGCKTRTHAAETMVLKGSAVLVDLEKTKLTLGLEMAPEEMVLECATVLVLLKGAMIGEVSGVENGKNTKTATVIDKQEKGKQAIKECHLTKATCEGKKFQLEAAFSGGAFEEAGAELEAKVTLSKEVSFDF
jgi:hypothetical protein